ncbi:MAG: hypothetical protein ACE15F_08695 [bacterium]
MRILRTLWLSVILSGMMRAGLADEIVRIRHASPQDYLGSWGAGFTVPPAEALFQEASKRPVLEALTPAWEFYVDSAQETPAIHRRSRLNPADTPKMWGKFPKGDAFSNPLAAHGRIWLFARNQGKWVLCQAAFDRASPQWISAGLGPSGIVQFFLDEDSDPILVYMDNDRRWRFQRGKFTGGGQSLVWEPEEKITRLEAQVLLQTAREAVTRLGMTGEFDIGGEGVFLSLSCQAPRDILFRYRSSPEAGQPYGPWSDPQSRETIQLNQRGRYFQYQLLPGGQTVPSDPVSPQITLCFTHAKDSASGRGTSVARAGSSLAGVTANDGGFGKNLASVVEGMAFGDQLSQAAAALDPEALTSLENSSREEMNNPQPNPASSEITNPQKPESGRASVINPRLSEGSDKTKSNPADSASTAEKPSTAGRSNGGRTQPSGSSPYPEKQKFATPSETEKSGTNDTGSSPSDKPGPQNQTIQDPKDTSPEKPPGDEAKQPGEENPVSPDSKPSSSRDSSPSKIQSPAGTKQTQGKPSSSGTPAQTADDSPKSNDSPNPAPASPGPGGEDGKTASPPEKQAGQAPSAQKTEGEPTSARVFNYGIENPASPNSASSAEDQGKAGKTSASQKPREARSENQANQGPEARGEQSGQAESSSTGDPDAQNLPSAGPNTPGGEANSEPSSQPNENKPKSEGGSPQKVSVLKPDGPPGESTAGGHPGGGGDSSFPSSSPASPDSSGAEKQPAGPASGEDSHTGESPEGDSSSPQASHPENAEGDATNPNAERPSKGPAGEVLPPGFVGGAGNASGPGPRVFAATENIDAATRYVLDVAGIVDSVRGHPGWWGLALLVILSPFLHRGIQRWIASRTVEGAIERFPPVQSARERTEAWIQRINEKVFNWNYVIRFQPWVTAADLSNESLILMNEEGKIAGVSLETFTGTGRAVDSAILFKHLASLSISLWNVRFAQDNEELLLLGRDAKGKIKGKRFRVPTFDKGRRLSGPRALYRVVRLFSRGRRDWTVGDSEGGRMLMTRQQNRILPSQWREERPAELEGGAVITLSGGYEPILAGVPAEDPDHLWMFRREHNGRKEAVWKPIAKTDYSGQECLMHVTARRGFIIETSEKSRRLGVHLFARDAKGSFNVRFSNTVSVPCAARYFAVSLAKDFLFVLGREDTPGSGSLSSFVLLVAYTGDLLRLPGQAEE